MPDLTLLIAFACGAGAVLAARGAWRRRAVNRWPTARARVEHTEVQVVDDHHRRADRDDHPRRFLARVHYRFEVEGDEYRSDNGRFDGVPDFPNREAAEAFLARTPPGSRLTVRYDPASPELTQHGEYRLPTARLGLAAFLAVASIGALWLRIG
ncbi:DUF3592 domain-containing protein [Halomonas getboli]|uniref:DUF3592 domain-containing protein n=1 Tax=Halomonas getboli TaxID=2935862 RepID=UPI001FFFA45B|nr:DUF3592 domain-containing protein [Halomonas getboli]MCK2183070.1 DUF3592 domain-containing protein [Halomonas getboli]